MILNLISKKPPGFSEKSGNEVKYFKNDEVLILLKALPVEVSIPVVSIMSLYFTSSELNRYYKDNLCSKEKDILEYFFYNYYIKESKTETFSENITSQEANHISLEIGVGLTWLVPIINKTIEDLRKSVFEKKGGHYS